MRCSSLLLALMLLAGYAAAEIGPRNIYFQHLDSEKGLSGEFVNDVAQDGRGHIWIATQSGLNRYDGRSVVVYEHDAARSNSLSHNFVRSLYVDAQGELWIATNGGLNRYDYESDSFQRNPLGLSAAHGSLRTRAVISDTLGTFWVGTLERGLFRVDPKGQIQHFRAVDEVGALPDDNIVHLAQGEDGRIWVATDGGLAYFDDHFDRFVTYRHDPQDRTSLPSDQIGALYWGQNTTLWVGTSAGLVRMDTSTGTFYPVRDETNGTTVVDSVLSILEDDDGTLWVGCENSLYEWQPEARRLTRYRQADNATNLRNWQINGFLQDASGVLWLATNGGASSWNYISDAFAHISAGNNELLVNLVTSVAEGEAGTLWIGTFGGGLTQLDRASGSVRHHIADRENPHSLADDRVMALHVDRDGRLWIGTRGGGLNRMDADARFSVFSHDDNNPNTLSGDAISAITSGPDGAIWVAAFGSGLNRLDPVSGSVTRFAHDPDDASSLSSNRVLSLLFDATGRLVVGTEDGGLNVFDARTGGFARFSLYPPNSQGNKGAAWAMSEDPEGTLWIGTMNQGLLGWSQERRNRGEPIFSQLGADVGLPNSIQGIGIGVGGELWASSNRGLFQIDLKTRNVVRYDQRSGLKVSDFLQGANLRGRDGQLYFGSNQGLVAFSPYDLRRSTNYPEVHVTARSRESHVAKTVSSAEQVTMARLDKSDPFVAFDFAALDYVSPENNRYRYILHGFDNNWIPQDQYGRAVYSNLPPGDYVFEVAAANNHGEWNPQTARLRINVPPPFWQSGNAYLLYGIALFLLLYLYARKRRLERAKAEEMRLDLERQVQERTRALEDGYAQLQQLNAKLAEVSVTDSLTGLRNRRYVDGYLETEIANIKRRRKEQGPQNAPRIRSATSLYFMMIDLDGFKAVNDQYGHNAGDEVLLQVSQMLVGLVRESDIVVRWGGDEFMIIGHSNTFAGVKILAERIREALDMCEFKFQGGVSKGISGSIGIAPYPFADDSNLGLGWEQVCRIADRGTYLAKDNGRNAWVSLSGTAAFTAADTTRVATELRQLVEEGKLVIDSALDRELVIDAQDVGVAAR